MRLVSGMLVQMMRRGSRFAALNQVGRRLFPGATLRRTLAGMFALAPAASTGLAQDADFKRGRLGHLSPYIGTFHLEAVLDDPAVAASVLRLMGPLADRLPDNMRVRVPIEFVSGSLVLIGRAPHEEGALEAASVWVDIFTGYSAVIFLHEGRVTVFTEPASTLPASSRFRAAIRDIGKSTLDIELPEGLVWIVDGEERDPANVR